MTNKRDRDKYEPKVPPPGAVTAAPSKWADDEDTGSHDVAGVEAADKRLRERVKVTTKQVVETGKVAIETQQIAADTSARVDETVTGITTLRMEVKEHLVAQDEKIDGLATDVSGVRGDVKVLTAHMDHVRTTTDKILPTLLEQLTKDRDAIRTEDVIVRSASVEVHKHKEIAEVDVVKQKELAAISDAASQKEFLRKRDLKIVGIVGTIAAGVVALVEFLIHG